MIPLIVFTKEENEILSWIYLTIDREPWFYRALYGKDCLNTGYMQMSGKPNDYEKTGTSLTEELKSPALPTGPLDDRVQ